MEQLIYQLNSTIKILGEIFRRPRYIVIAIFGALAMLSFAVWFPNFGLVGTLLMSEKLTLIEKVLFVVNSFQSLNTSFNVLSRILTVTNAVLLGINVAMFIY